LPGLIREWMTADSSRRTQLMESIILHWTGVHDISVTDASQDPQAMRKLAAIENLVGRKFRDGWLIPIPGIAAVAIINDAFDKLSALLEDQLIAQVDALPLLRAMSPGNIPGEGTKISGFDKVAEMLRIQLDGNPDMMRLVRTGNVLDRLDVDGKALLQVIADRSKSESGLFALQLQAFTSTDSCTFGGDQDDLIYASSLSEWIEGRQGNDSLFGSDGHDILIGGAGNDSMAGGYGNDVYALASGDGADVLADIDFTPANFDEVRFVDVKSEDVRGLQRVGSNLLLHYGRSDQLTMQNHFAGEAYRIEQFRVPPAWRSRFLPAECPVVPCGSSPIPCRSLSAAGSPLSA
jgi:hypothetical protein